MTDFSKEHEMASDEKLDELEKFDKNEGYYENTSDDATFNWPMLEFMSSIVVTVIVFIGLCFLAVCLYRYCRERRGRRRDMEMEYTNTGSQASTRCTVQQTQTDEQGTGELAVSAKKLTDEDDETDSKKLTVERPSNTDRQDSSARQCDDDDDDDDEEMRTDIPATIATTPITMSALHTSQTEMVGVSEQSVNWFGSVGTVPAKGDYTPLPREETLTDNDTETEDEHSF